jgi:hypothetical protein
MAGDDAAREDPSSSIRGRRGLARPGPAGPAHKPRLSLQQCRGDGLTGLLHVQCRESAVCRHVAVQRANVRRPPPPPSPVPRALGF